MFYRNKALLHKLTLTDYCGINYHLQTKITLEYDFP
jgi:hypothetical protein